METKNERLEFFTNYLEIQKSYVLSSYKQSADFAFLQLKRDKTIKTLLEDNKNSSINELESNNLKLISYTTPLFNDLKTSGFSSLNYITSNTRIALKKDKTIADCQFSKNIHEDTSSIKSITGFYFKNDFIGYKYIYPYIEKTNHLGCFEFGFDYHSIKNRIIETNDKIEVGFIVLLNDTNRINGIDFKQEFSPVQNFDNLWIEHDFNFPEKLIKKGKLKEQFINQLTLSIDSANHSNFSLYLNKGKNASAITFNKLITLDATNTAYLVSINKDHMLTKAKELNNAILIINLIIIVLAMIGFSYLVINRLNILEQKRNIQKSEHTLKELNQSKDKFFSIVAHDLKNPFNGIMGLSGYLFNEFESVDNEEKKEIINDINIASKNAFNLLQNLLEWTRTQSGLIKNVPTIIEPKNIVSISLETVTNIAKNKDIVIKETYETEEKGYADENLVATVIRNLTTNAIKFSPRKSVVEILVNKHEKELFFCIKDQGIGLNDEDVDKLFRIDINFHKRGTEKEPGSGLGLKLCKEFVEYCGGRIWVISTPGEGSSFYFTIPLHIENKA